jgi:hypothetical protein
LSERRLRLELRPSPLLAAAAVGLHAAAAAAALLALPGTPGALLAGLLLALGAWTAWSRALLRAPSSVRVLELDGTRAGLTLAGGATLEGELAGRRYVSRHVVALALRGPARRALLVTPDMLGGDSFRRLRIFAIWGRLPAVAAKQLPA